MGLRNCPNCEHPISRSTKECPNCGNLQIRIDGHVMWGLLGVFFVLAIIVGLFSHDGTPTTSPKPAAAFAKPIAQIQKPKAKSPPAQRSPFQPKAQAVPAKSLPAQTSPAKARENPFARPAPLAILIVECLRAEYGPYAAYDNYPEYSKTGIRCRFKNTSKIYFKTWAITIRCYDANGTYLGYGFGGATDVGPGESKMVSVAIPVAPIPDVAYTQIWSHLVIDNSGNQIQHKFQTTLTEWKYTTFSDLVGALFE